MEIFKEKLDKILSGVDYVTNTLQKKRIIETNEPIVVFGVGHAGVACYDMLIDWGCRCEIVFCDNYKSGTKKGTRIISFNELVTNLYYFHSIIIIAIGTKGSSEVYKQLIDNKITEERIILRDFICDKVDVNYIKANEENLKKIYEKLGDDLSREVFWKKVESALYCKINMNSVYKSGEVQYFDKLFEFNGKEVFIDCGSYIGDTALEFIKRTRNLYSHIFAFEPEVENCKSIQKNLSSYEDITIINKGLWDQEAKLRFNSGGGAASSISSNGEIEIEVTYIDSLLKTAYIPTIIKMDIEGSEIRAICGAAETIRVHKPKLAICIYHKPTDIIEIPMLINQLNPDYKYYLRHYESGFSWAETVLYAI